MLANSSIFGVIWFVSQGSWDKMRVWMEILSHNAIQWMELFIASFWSYIPFPQIICFITLKYDSLF